MCTALSADRLTSDIHPAQWKGSGGWHSFSPEVYWQSPCMVYEKRLSTTFSWRVAYCLTTGSLQV